MDEWQRIRKSEVPVMQRTLNETASEHILIRDAISLIIEGLIQIPPFRDNEALLARISLLSHNLNNLLMSFDAARRGYYIQSISILRNVYENWLAFWYLAQFPDDAHYWLYPRWDRRPPKAETMRNKIQHPSKDNKKKLYEFYNELNRFDHTDPIAVISRIKATEDRTVIGIGVQFEAESFLACSYALSLWAGYVLDGKSAIIPKGDTWHADYWQMLDRILDSMEKYNTQYGGLDLSPEDNSV